MTNHCKDRLTERYGLEITEADMYRLRKLIQLKYFVHIKDQDLSGNQLVLTRYKGRYIILVTDRKMKALITALPYLQYDLQYVEQFVEEFDREQLTRG